MNNSNYTGRQDEQNIFNNTSISMLIILSVIKIFNGKLLSLKRYPTLHKLNSFNFISKFELTV